MTDTIVRTTPLMGSGSTRLPQEMGQFTSVDVNNGGSGKNDDSMFDAEEGSSQRENAMKRASMIARMYAMFDARADAINARQDARRTAFYDAQDAKLKALQDDITALQLKRLAEEKALNGSDHDGKIAIPASAPDALTNVLATPTKAQNDGFANLDHRVHVRDQQAPVARTQEAALRDRRVQGAQLARARVAQARRRRVWLNEAQDRHRARRI